MTHGVLQTRKWTKYEFDSHDEACLIMFKSAEVYFRAISKGPQVKRKLRHLEDCFAR